MFGPAEAWNVYLAALEAQPLLTKCATSAVLLPAGDLAAQ
eukprot:Cvel_27779.t1-p1 / transcript=Cvel_27779.t1 / gene=Cvel_27779 / organism=Chromera_velia_CCMP2878 / gene_product=hypothetical protein / transcript_product=hypothetical protein / location=Cvel_scaffold3524:166-282(-) / protein_length=39 / sequence_SO=supercontig / SO=protein_coding / is_pseudo=false